jgi:hypothetical protein
LPLWTCGHKSAEGLAVARGCTFNLLSQIAGQTSDRSDGHEGPEARVMAKTKKRAAPPFPRTPVIPDEVWVPFTVSLTGSRAHDKMAIDSLAYIFGIDPRVIKYRLIQEMDERRIMIHTDNVTIH